MPMELSRIVGSIPTSSTLAISARAKTMKAQGLDVVNFGVGEPDFDTPPNIRQAGIDAINTGQTRYTPAAGTPQLRRAVVDKMKRDYNIQFTPEEVIVSSGAKSSISYALAAILNRGDNVLIPSPFWLSYPQMVAAGGGKPKIVRTTEKQGFKLTPETLRKAVNAKTKAIILNTPSNPTGAVYTRDELAAVAGVIDEAGIYVISDEIYEKLVYGDASHTCILEVCPALRDRTIIINGGSKTYAMTGWRLGYALGPKSVITAMTRLQSHVAGNTCSIAQAAMVEALNGDQSEVEKMRDIFDDRRQYIVGRVKKITRVKLLEPKGAFYALLNIKSAIKHLGCGDSKEFAMRLLEEKQVAAVPGVDFGTEGYIRFSYATSMENIEKGLHRLKEFVTGK